MIKCCPLFVCVCVIFITFTPLHQPGYKMLRLLTYLVVVKYSLYSILVKVYISV